MSLQTKLGRIKLDLEDLRGECKDRNNRDRLQEALNILDLTILWTESIDE